MLPTPAYCRNIIQYIDTIHGASDKVRVRHLIALRKEMSPIVNNFIQYQCVFCAKLRSLIWL